MLAAPATAPPQMNPSAAHLVIGNKRYSSWSMRPWLFMSHFAVPFTEHRLALDSDEFRDQVHRWSPSGLVPVLHHDGLVVWDSLAICEYVNETWLEGRGWPQEQRLRAQARSAAAEMHSGFAAMRRQLPMNVDRQPDGYRWNADADRDIARVGALWAVLLDASGGPFLGGEFGVVDAMYAPVAIRFRGYGVELTPPVEAYVTRLYSLPAFERWLREGRAEPERLAKYESLTSVPSSPATR